VSDTEASDDALLNLEAKSAEELRELLDVLYEEEQKVSYRRRVLHGKIDILRAELVRRMKAEREEGEDIVSATDIVPAGSIFCPVIYAACRALM